jgi:hypothetical protein
MRNPELFMMLSSIDEHIERKQWDSVERIVKNTLWAVADKDWKAANIDMLEKLKQL